MARKPLIAGNWKMNLNHLEGIALVQKIAFTLPDKYLKHVEVAVIPPFTALRSVQTLIEADKLGLAYGAQDLSAARFRRLHRRDLRQHAGQARLHLRAGRPLGAPRVPRRVRRTAGQEGQRRLQARADPAALLRRGPGGPRGRQSGRSTPSIRCWPPWSTSRPSRPPPSCWPTSRSGPSAPAGWRRPADAQEVCGAARAALAEKYGAEIADGIRILYGGSVKSGNVSEITAQPDVDGALVGGASLDGTEFANLAANAVGVLP